MKAAGICAVIASLLLLLFAVGDLVSAHNQRSSDLQDAHPSFGGDAVFYYALSKVARDDEQQRQDGFLILIGGIAVALSAGLIASEKRYEHLLEMIVDVMPEQDHTGNEAPVEKVVGAS